MKGKLKAIKVLQSDRFKANLIKEMQLAGCSDKQILEQLQECRKHKSYEEFIRCYHFINQNQHIESWYNY